MVRKSHVAHFRNAKTRITKSNLYTNHELKKQSKTNDFRHISLHKLNGGFSTLARLPQQPCLRRPGRVERWVMIGWINQWTGGKTFLPGDQMSSDICRPSNCAPGDGVFAAAVSPAGCCLLRSPTWRNAVVHFFALCKVSATSLI